VLKENENFEFFYMVPVKYIIGKAKLTSNHLYFRQIIKF